MEHVAEAEVGADKFGMGSGCGVIDRWSGIRACVAAVPEPRCRWPARARHHDSIISVLVFSASDKKV